MLQLISNLYSLKVYLNLTFDNQGSRISCFGVKCQTRSNIRKFCLHDSKCRLFLTCFTFCTISVDDSKNLTHQYDPGVNVQG